MVSGSSTASGFVRIADLIPSRYGVLFEVDDPPARQPSDRVTFFPLDHQSVPHARGLSYGYREQRKITIVFVFSLSPQPLHH
jgi:hypothetical protein